MSYKNKDMKDFKAPDSPEHGGFVLFAFCLLAVAFFYLLNSF